MDMPIAIAIVDLPERINSIIAPLAEIAPNAMMTVHPVEVVRPGVGIKRD
jgi:PII-like signaling protein